MSGTNKTSKMSFKPVWLSIAIVPLPFIGIYSPFPILTLETVVLPSSLKRSWSFFMWFIQPLSTSQLSEVFLLTKHVAANNCSSWHWSTTALVSSYYWFLQILSTCPCLPHLLHFTSGLHQHFCGEMICLLAMRTRCKNSIFLVVAIWLVVLLLILLSIFMACIFLHSCLKCSFYNISLSYESSLFHSLQEM